MVLNPTYFRVVKKRYIIEALKSQWQLEKKCMKLSYVNFGNLDTLITLTDGERVSIKSPIYRFQGIVTIQEQGKERLIQEYIVQNIMVTPNNKVAFTILRHHHDHFEKHMTRLFDMVENNQQMKLITGNGDRSRRANDLALVSRSCSDHAAHILKL
jgi:hypothetical protein